MDELDDFHVNNNYEYNNNEGEHDLEQEDGEELPISNNKSSVNTINKNNDEDSK